MDCILCIGNETLDIDDELGVHFPLEKYPEIRCFVHWHFPLDSDRKLYILSFSSNRNWSVSIEFWLKMLSLLFISFFLSFFVWIVFLVNVQCVVAVAGECISIIMEWNGYLIMIWWEGYDRAVHVSHSLFSLCSEHALICVIWLFRLSQRITGQMNGLYRNQPATATRSICVCLNLSNKLFKIFCTWI